MVHRESGFLEQPGWKKPSRAHLSFRLQLETQIKMQKATTPGQKAIVGGLGRRAKTKEPLGRQHSHGGPTAVGHHH